MTEPRLTSLSELLRTDFHLLIHVPEMLLTDLRHGMVRSFTTPKGIISFGECNGMMVVLDNGMPHHPLSEYNVNTVTFSFYSPNSIHYSRRVINSFLIHIPKLLRIGIVDGKGYLITVITATNLLTAEGVDTIMKRKEMSSLNDGLILYFCFCASVLDHSPSLYYNDIEERRRADILKMEEEIEKRREEIEKREEEIEKREEEREKIEGDHAY